MFKKFSRTEDIASSTAIKSSHQRGIRAKLTEQMPLLAQPFAPDGTGADGQEQEQGEGEGEPAPTLLETLWPKKEGLTLVKCREHVSILALHGQPLFFQHFDGPYYPTLRLLQQYPELLPKVQVDKGAIKFVLAGANIMCPGITSKGGYLAPSLAVGAPVAVFAEAKGTPCAIGSMKMSSAEIQSVNKGHGVENCHWLGDDLWNLKEI